MTMAADVQNKVQIKFFPDDIVWYEIMEEIKNSPLIWFLVIFVKLFHSCL